MSEINMPATALTPSYIDQKLITITGSQTPDETRQLQPELKSPVSRIPPTAPLKSPGIVVTFGQQNRVRMQTTQRHIMDQLTTVSSQKTSMTPQVRLPTWILNAASPQGFEVMLSIMPRVYVSKSSLIECVQAINDVTPVIQPGAKYTLQDLVGDELWLANSVYQRSILGIVWRRLVSESFTPFTYGDLTCRTPKRYMLS